MPLLPVTLNDAAVDEINCAAQHPVSKKWYAGNALGQLNTCFSDTTYTVGDGSITAMAFHPKGKELAIAHENELKIHDSSDFTTVVFAAAARFTMSITHLQYTATGQHIFISSEDDSGIAVYACTTRAIELKIDTLSSGVRSFAVDSSGSYLAVVTMDGTVLIHKLLFDEGPVRRQYHSYDMVTVKNTLISKELCRNTTAGFTISFQPTPLMTPATHVVFAHQGGAALLLSRVEKSDDWSEKHFLVTPDDSDFSHGSSDVNMAQFSPNGRFLLTGDALGRVVVWSVVDLNGESGSVDAIKMLQLESDRDGDERLLRAMNFGPDDGNNYVVFVTAEEEAKVEPIVNTDLGYPAPTGEVVEEQKDIESTEEKAVPAVLPTPPVTAVISAGKRLLKGSSGEGGDDSDGDEFFDVSVEKLKEQFKPTTSDEGNNLSSPLEIDDDAGAEGSDDTMSRLEELLAAGGKEYVAKLEQLLENDGGDVVRGLPTAYPPFQPSSTFPNHREKKQSPEEAAEEARSRRWHYLVWNAVGSITCLNEDTNNRIEVQFSDVNGPNKAIAFDDTDMFTRAALSMHGAAFTSDIQKGGGEKIPSVLLYRAFHSTFTSLTPNETFRYELPAGEGATAVACGRGFVAVATSKNLLRVFSATGMQLSVTLLKGPLMCLVGGGSYLAVMYYCGAQVDRHQSLVMRAEVFDVTPAGARVAVSADMVLKSRERMSWATVTENGMLCVSEKNGTLYGLMPTMGGQWAPLLDTKPLVRTEQHLLWPVAVKDNKLCFVMLNGETRPGVHPKPVVTARPFRLPTIDAHPKGNAENDRVRNFLWETSECANLAHIHQQYVDAVRREGSGACSVSVPESLGSVVALEDQLEESRLHIDKANLRLLHECCKTQRLAVALDIITRLQTVTGLQNAITIANHTGRTNLAQVVEDILSEREQQDQFNYNYPTQSASQYPSSQAADSQHHGYMSPQYGGEHDEFQVSEEETESQLTNGRSLNLNRHADFQQEGHAKKPVVFNPFATNKAAPQSTPSPVVASNTFHSTSQKDPVKKVGQIADRRGNKREHEALMDSPPPSSPKKPLLARNTSFATEARWKKHNDRNVI